MKSKALNRARGPEKVKIQLPISMGSIAAICGAISLASLVSTDAQAQAACGSLHVDLSSRSEAGRAYAEFGSRLLAVGRVDSVSARRGVEILGRFAQPAAAENYQVGDYAAVVDWSMKDSKARILEVRPIASRYVPGASEVYLKAAVQIADVSRGQLRVGTIGVDYSAALLGIDSASSLLGQMIRVGGTQPEPRGVVLGNCVLLARKLAHSRDRNRPDGSLGTGRPDGSLGTGRPDGSLGTGKRDGSLGTGKPDGSLGTGRPDGSLGTGKRDGSLGTGKP